MNRQQALYDIEHHIEKARRGQAGLEELILDYIKRFNTIILRGAGNFGSAFGAFLLEEGLSEQKIIYWDKRAPELKEINGIDVITPFSSDNNGDITLVINCIPNGSLSGSVGKEEFASKGYNNYLSGMALFEALMCNIKPETGFDAQVCLDTKFCNWCSCKRLSAMMPKKEIKPTEPLVYSLATFVLNQKCTLSCAHCGQYINHYTKDEQINFPLAELKTTIDNVFDAVDGIGYVSIIGGEPFLHPQLAEVIEYIISKSNFGVIGVTTNGICKITDELLDKLNNGKTRIIFSDYTAALNDKQKEIFDKNVNKVADAGLSYTVGQPIWATPASLRKLNLSEADLIEKKANCNSRITCKTIQNGVYYPCSTTAAMGTHHLANFENDWVEVNQSNDSPETLREKLQKVDEQPYYQSCDHCGEGGEELALAGEQGISEVYFHIDEIKKNKAC